MDLRYRFFPNCWVRRKIEQKKSSSSILEGDPFVLWQERILYITCVLGVFGGPFALVPSVWWLFLQEGLTHVIILDVALYLFIVVVFLWKGLPLRVKAGSIFFVCYLLGTVLLFNLGPTGAGYIWLLGASILISNLYSLQAAFYSLLCNVAILMFIAGAIAADQLEWARQLEKPLQLWLVLGSNFLLVNSVVSICFALMLKSLRETFQKEKQMRINLEESENRLHAVFDSVESVSIQGYNKERRVVYWNKASEKLYGYRAEEAMGSRLEDLIFSEAMCKDAVADIQAWYENDIAIPAAELELRNKFADTVYVFSSHVMTTDSRGEKIMFCIDIDLSPLKQIEKEKAKYEDQYRQAQKMESIGRLAGGIAHDLNNLLVPVIGYCEILANDACEVDSRAEFLDNIYEAGLKARNLVRQLLVFSRKQPIQMQKVDLAVVVTGFEKFLRRIIQENIQLHIVAEDKAMPINADSNQIEQVLMNLSVNAADAMPSGGRLLVEVRTERINMPRKMIQGDLPVGEYAVLSIQDNGVGMDDETRLNIFEPFFSTKGTEGTGLGLATVYGIIKQHGGNIQVTSVLEEGTVFMVYLPLLDNEEKDVQDVAVDDIESSGQATILLVEDNVHVRALTNEILQNNGYSVLSASNGHDALALIQREGALADLLLTDVIMPEMNGSELYQKVLEVCPELKVMYMSGYTDNVISQHGILDQHVNFINKPFTEKELITKISSVLRCVPQDFA
ncbi:MAG: hypothetical protein CSA21_00865 [Deltaproteobacteria bacterium]|nr:MAG: hypothetical protein CSA21_00865 [Deltaproteobacteria bacterium]